ncbi:hypothetical protein ACIQWR_41080 [Streptomyces sp. NPDC098789]|uniref:hypothetical protein n=1 Tax=Streptomyces sp. NPDC098789 TaxID=3366098 RepID=UPI0037FDCE51
MPENTFTTPLAPMELDDVTGAFAYIRAWQAGDVDTAGRVADLCDGAELRQLLLEVLAHIVIPVTAVDDHDGEPCTHAFLAAALGQVLLDTVSHADGACLAFSPGIAQTIVRFTETILTDNHGDVADVLRQLEAAGIRQAMKEHPAHRTTA